MHMSQVDSPLAQAVVLVEVETETAVAEAWDSESSVCICVAEAEALRATEAISVDTFTNAEATKAEATVLLGVPVDWC